MFTDSPTELTTSVTDLLLAIQAFLAVITIARLPDKRPMWTRVWVIFFGMLCLASSLGAVVHGVQMASTFQSAIWSSIYLVLGLLMAVFVVAALTMTWNHELSRRSLPYLLALAIAFFAVTQIWSDSFMLFILYEGVSMVVALVLYTWCIFPCREQGAMFIATGIVVGIVAAIIDSQSSLRVSLIWVFDNHGMFHIVQMISLTLIIIGVHRSHGPKLCVKKGTEN